MQKRKIFAILLALVLAFGILPMSVAAEENTITVFVSIEGYNLGHGFYVEPTAVNLPAGSSAWDATVALLEAEDLEFELTPWGGLDRIFDIHPGFVELPGYITVELGEGATDGSVGSFDYSDSSGWLYTVNHFQAPVGAADFVLVTGDVIRWHFSVEGWGADLGLGFERGAWSQLYEHADKTELIRGMFADGANPDAVEAALEVIINPTSTQDEVDAAFADLDLPSENVDKTYLAAAITDGTTRDRATYVPADAEWDPPTWGLFQTALAAAEFVYANEAATPLAVQGATERLVAALAALEPIPYVEEEPADDDPIEEDVVEEDNIDDTIDTITWTNPFVDVSEDDWFYEHVRFVYTNDLMIGTAVGVFSPNGSLTRAMAITLLWRAAGEPATETDSTAWYAVAVAWAYAEGIIPSDTIAAREVLTIAQFADMLGIEAEDGPLTRADAAAMIRQFVEQE